MKTRSLIMIALLLPAMAFAEPDFNGTWVRDGAKSDVVPNTMYWLTRGVDAGGGRGRNNQIVIEVQQSAGLIKVADPARPPRSLTLDGKPHSMPTDTGMQMATVISTLQGETLVVSTTQPFGGMPGNLTLKITETWSLSADGKVLTVRTERETPALRQSFSEQYDRRR
jgi:hypothetical protein